MKATNDTEKQVWFQAYCAALSGILSNSTRESEELFVSDECDKHADCALEKYRELDK